MLHTIARNKKANFNFHIKKTFEAGLVLKGAEVKAVRTFCINIESSYVKFENGEAFLVESYIKEFNANKFDTYAAKRPRKLLLKKRELLEISGKGKIQGYTVVPISVYYKRGLIKVLIGIAEGKKLFDKRADIKEKEWKRGVAREGRIKG